MSFTKMVNYATDGAPFPDPYQNKEMTMKSAALQIAVLLPIALLAALGISPVPLYLNDTNFIHSLKRR